MKKESKYGVPPIESRREFERNVYLVLEDFNRKLDGDDEALKANAVWSAGQHLKRVRTLPNGRIDLMTIDEGLRTMGNMHNWMRYMDVPRPKEQEKEANEPDKEDPDDDGKI